MARKESSATVAAEEPAEEAVETVFFDDAASEASSGLTASLLTRSLAEGIGTFFAVFLLLGTTITVAFSGGIAFLGLAAFAAYGVATFIFSRISGAHFNPAISLAAALSGRLSWVDMVCYMVAQVVGGIAAAALMVPVAQVMISANTQITSSQIWLMLSNTYGAYTQSMRSLNSTLVVVMIVELVAALIVVGSAAATMHKDGSNRRSYVIAVPLAYGIGTLFTYLFTGAGMNPARSTGAAIISAIIGGSTGSYAIKQLWIFWLVPLLAGAIVGLIMLLSDRDRTALVYSIESEEDDFEDDEDDDDDEAAAEDFKEAIADKARSEAKEDAQKDSDSDSAKASKAAAKSSTSKAKASKGESDK